MFFDHTPPASFDRESPAGSAARLIRLGIPSRMRRAADPAGDSLSNEAGGVWSKNINNSPDS